MKGGVNIDTQSRTKSPLFWVGLASAVFTAVVNAGVTAGVHMPWWIGAIGVGIHTVFVYMNGTYQDPIK